MLQLYTHGARMHRSLKQLLQRRPRVIVSLYTQNWGPSATPPQCAVHRQPLLALPAAQICMHQKIYQRSQIKRPHKPQNCCEMLITRNSCLRQSTRAVAAAASQSGRARVARSLQKGSTHSTHSSRRAAACAHCCVLARKKRAYGPWLTTAVATTCCAPVRLGLAQLTSRVPRCGRATACGAGAQNRGVCCYLCTWLLTCRC